MTILNKIQIVFIFISTLLCLFLFGAANEGAVKLIDIWSTDSIVVLWGFIATGQGISMYCGEICVRGRDRAGRSRGRTTKFRENSSNSDSNVDDFDLNLNVGGESRGSDASGSFANVSARGASNADGRIPRWASKNGGSWNDRSETDDSDMVRPDERVLEMAERSNNRGETFDSSAVAGIISGEGGKEGGANNVMPGLY